MLIQREGVQRGEDSPRSSRQQRAGDPEGSQRSSARNHNGAQMRREVMLRRGLHSRGNLKLENHSRGNLKREFLKRRLHSLRNPKRGYLRLSARIRGLRRMIRRLSEFPRRWRGNGDPRNYARHPTLTPRGQRREKLLGRKEQKAPRGLRREKQQVRKAPRGLRRGKVQEQKAPRGLRRGKLRGRKEQRAPREKRKYRGLRGRRGRGRR